jgi:DNA-binding NarL/FixJ family response regulator
MTPSHSNRTVVWYRSILFRKLATECLIYPECEAIDECPRGNKRVSRMPEGGALPSIRVLVADDHRDWRNQVRFLLQVRPELQVIFEASDGSEAVQKAGELKPDLILLDVGLPNLNGIEAARRIRKISPKSKIVFLSVDNSLDVVQVALSTGAQSYVYKARAQNDLLPAIDAALRGIQFVSSTLEGNRLTDIPDQKTAHRHEVLFYS